LICRAGFVAGSEKELPTDIRDYLDKLVKPYFAAIAEWYAAIGIGVPGGALYDIIHRRIGDPFFGVSLNPGHQIHLDEWVSSPIYPGSQVPIHSGMAMQVDVIPSSPIYFSTRMEDGVVITDESLRRQLAEQFPECSARCQRRRAFMADVLGIPLPAEVLPLSNIPAIVPPFFLQPQFVLAMES
jgi:hypothetical protein